MGFNLPTAFCARPRDLAATAKSRRLEACPSSTNSRKMETNHVRRAILDEKSAAAVASAPNAYPLGR